MARSGCWRGAILAAATIAMLPSAAALAADRHEVVAGWTLDDVGSKPGDDSDRNVTMRKSIPEVDLTYAAGQGADGGSIQMKFKRCLGLSYGSGFGFDNPPPDHATQVRHQIDEAFAEFAENCPAKDQGETRLMAGFDEAFRTIESWVKAKPFAFPREELPPTTSDDADTPAGPTGPDVPMI